MIESGKRWIESEAKAWIRFRNGSQGVISITSNGALTAPQYAIFTAYETDPDYLGCILFDEAGYWIYDGEILHPDEQEQIAQFIINYQERL